jgi:antibiotic biosynthesis monooxygenase (ABM) superfamily enzyme
MTTTAASTTALNAAPAAPARPVAPIKWRQALLMGLAVYPFITLYILVLFPITEGWAIWQRTALLVPIMVVTMVYGIAPLLQKHLGWFITGRPAPTRK